MDIKKETGGDNNIWIWMAILIVAAFILMMFLRDKKEITTEENTTSPIIIDKIPAPVEIESSQDINGVTGTGAVTISYANALITYANKRIQLNALCQATPNTVTYKDNTGIMIDNRSTQTQTVKIGTTFTIKPYGFKIVVLPDVYLKSKTLMMNCDKSKNIATILVQE